METGPLLLGHSSENRRDSDTDDPTVQGSRAVSEMKLQLPACPCGKAKFRPYYKNREDQGSIIGICCNNCYQEWVEESYLITPDTDEKRQFVEIFGVILKKQFKRDVHDFSQTIFDEDKASRTKYTDVGEYLNEAKVGDHIAWKRSITRCYIWHHAIVIKIDKEKENVKVIHWDPVGFKSKNILGVSSGNVRANIVKQWLTPSEESGTLYTINHDSPIPVELVIARAHSRIGEVDYDLVSDNCEIFAYYCKTGLLWSEQTNALHQNAQEIVTKTLCEYAKKIASVDSVYIENYPQDRLVKLNAGTGSSEEHSPITVNIIIEGVYCVWDLTKIYQKRNKSVMTREDFENRACKEVSNAFFKNGNTIFLAIVFVLCVIGCFLYVSVPMIFAIRNLSDLPKYIKHVSISFVALVLTYQFLLAPYYTKERLIRTVMKPSY